MKKATHIEHKMKTVVIARVDLRNNISYQYKRKRKGLTSTKQRIQVLEAYEEIRYTLPLKSKSGSS